MGTSAQKLQKIRDSKEAIRLAIAAKGVDIPANTKLADYDDKIALIDEWVAPSDWIQLEEPNDNEILLLASDINPYYAFVVTVTGGYTVNWGDGTIDNWASGDTASHTYTVGAGQACSRGYTTFKIRIYATTGSNITNFKIALHTVWCSYTGFLWAKFGTRYFSNWTNTFTINNAKFVRSTYLECCQLPSQMAVDYGFSYTFLECYSLKKLIMPKNTTTKRSGSFSYWIIQTLITSLDLSGMKNITYFYHGMATQHLTKIKLFENFSNCALSTAGFSGVYADIIMPNNTGLLVSSNLFQNCSSKRIEFNSTYENCLTSMANMFNSCFFLEYLKFVDSVNLTNNNISNAFNCCKSLRTIKFPTNTGVAITSMQYLFYNCYNLEYVTNFPALNSVTNYTQAFYYCINLKDVPNLDQLGDTTTGMDLETTYAGCYSLNPAGGLRVRNKITGRFVLAGIDLSNRAALTALLFTNPGAVSTWAGSSPQIDVSCCSMEAAALNALFTSIIATSASFSGKTIRITGNPGAATCDTTIITNAGGTVNKTT